MKMLNLSTNSSANLSLQAVTYLLITFANSLDPDQDQQSNSPDLDLNCLTLLKFPTENKISGQFGLNKIFSLIKYSEPE